MTCSDICQLMNKCDQTWPTHSVQVTDALCTSTAVCSVHSALIISKVDFAVVLHDRTLTAG